MYKKTAKLKYGNFPIGDFTTISKLIYLFTIN